jgi:hypothetical protein
MLFESATECCKMVMVESGAIDSGKSTVACLAKYLEVMSWLCPQAIRLEPKRSQTSRQSGEESPCEERS